MTATAMADWCVASASRPHPAETTNGDAVVVRKVADGLLVAVIDALGHGVHAAATAAKAAATFSALPTTMTAAAICRSFHESLRGTRGIAATVVRVERDRVQGCGVGNVELRAVGANVSALLNPGILGVRALRFRTFDAGVPARARILLFTDGISARFDGAKLAALSPEAACEHILAQWSKPSDDATILILERA